MNFKASHLDYALRMWLHTQLHCFNLLWWSRMNQLPSSHRTTSESCPIHFKGTLPIKWFISYILCASHLGNHRENGNNQISQLVLLSSWESWQLLRQLYLANRHNQMKFIREKFTKCRDFIPYWFSLTMVLGSICNQRMSMALSRMIAMHVPFLFESLHDYFDYALWELHGE